MLSFSFCTPGVMLAWTLANLYEFCFWLLKGLMPLHTLVRVEPNEWSFSESDVSEVLVGITWPSRSCLIRAVSSMYILAVCAGR